MSLDDGGYAGGDLAPSDRPGVLRFKAAGFVTPFEFKLGRVNAIHWTPAEKPVKPEGEFCFELGGGDVVFGGLAGLDESGGQLDVPRIGRMHVERSAIRRIYRWKASADLVYLGPNGLAGWRRGSPASGGAASGRRAAHRGGCQSQRMGNEPDEVPHAVAESANPQPAETGWRDEAGQLMTDKEGASIHGDFAIPARASIEFEVSWKKKPDFVFALGTNDQPESVKRVPVRGVGRRLDRAARARKRG